MVKAAGGKILCSCMDSRLRGNDETALAQYFAQLHRHSGHTQRGNRIVSISAGHFPPISVCCTDVLATASEACGLPRYSVLAAIQNVARLLATCPLSHRITSKPNGFLATLR